ncbi:hypothetical protein NA57DRAFT_57304 [Rhizodiscina lignyota]|uniref:Uncharacterized protein n=1 Tax=Rhizodiscina lignyota TaxID=1504668 RepID=A0A9P4IEE6_9PEZI|nr:hypothetical protein NA57DRAFT_57304 [Rhizodiscina lignyota]
MQSAHGAHSQNAAALSPAASGGAASAAFQMWELVIARRDAFGHPVGHPPREESIRDGNEHRRESFATPNYTGEQSRRGTLCLGVHKAGKLVAIMAHRSLANLLRPADKDTLGLHPY